LILAYFFFIAASLTQSAELPFSLLLHIL
jgi:hypothetical protein